MKSKLILSLLLIAALLSGCKSVPDNAVAIVDGDVITIDEYMDEFNVYKKTYENKSGEAYFDTSTEDGAKNLEVLKEYTIKNLIYEHIVLKAAEAEGITASDEEIDAALKKSIDAVGEQKFEDTLKKNRLTKEMVRKNFKTKLIIDRYVEKFQSGVNVTDEEAKKYFEANKNKLISVKVSHILTKSEEEAKELKYKIKTVEEFEEAAKKYSLDTSSAVHGGSLGYITKGEIPEFDKYAFSLKKGEISEPFRTELGYHIIMVVDKKDTFAELKESILGYLKAEAYEKHIKELQDKAKIDMFLDKVDGQIKSKTK